MSSSQDHSPVALRLARLPGWLLAIGFGLGYFLCAKISVFFSVRASPFITFWLPVGFYLGVLLMTGYRRWPWVVIGALAGNFAFDLQLGTRFGLIVFFYLSNTLISLISALLIRRYIAFQPAISSLKELAGLLGLAGITGSGLGSLTGGVGLTIFDPQNSFMKSWGVAWADDAMAIMLLTPLMLSWCAGPRLQRRMYQKPEKLPEAILLAIGLAAITWHVFSSGPASLATPYNFELVPLLLWSGLRFGPRGAAAATFALALMMAHFVSHRLNLQTEGMMETSQQVFLLQSIIIVAAVVAMVPAVVLEERDRTLTTLRESQEKFFKVFRAGPDAISVSELETGKLIEINENFEKLFQCRREEITGHSALEFGFWADPGDRTRMLKMLKGTGTVKNYQAAGRSRDGKVFPCLISAEIVEIAGKPCAVIVVTNITERLLAELALRESEEKFSKAFRASPDAMSVSEIESRKLIEVNDSFEQLFKWKRAEVVGRSALELKLWVDDAERIRLFGPLIRDGSVKNFQGLCQNRHGEAFPCLISAEIVDIAGLRCAVLVITNITERLQAEKALRESEEKFSKAFRASPDGIAISEVETGRFIEVNEGYGRLFGYAHTEMIGKTSVDLGIWENLEDRDRLRKELQSRGALSNFEARTRARNGALKIVMISAEIIELGGRQCFVAVLHDVTERRRAEHALRVSEESLRATIEETPNVCVQWFDAAGRVVYWNKASEAVYGWTSAEAVGLTLDRLIFTPGQHAEFLETLKQVAQDHQTVGPVAFPFRHRNGSTGTVLSTLFSIPVRDGGRRYVCMDVDITEQKRAEQALQENQRILTTLLSNLPGLAYRCKNNPDWTMLFVSEGCRELTGYAPEELQNSQKSTFAQLIHPDDQTKVWDMVQAAVKEHRPFELNYRIRTAGGEEKWVWERGRGIFAPDGTLETLEGFITDITAMRRAETERTAAIAREQQARISYTLQLIASQEAERTRIARELHDSLGQNLLLIKNRAQMALLPEFSHGNWQDQIQKVMDLSTLAIGEVRQISRDLHPYQLDHLGFTRAVTLMIDDAAQSSGITFDRKIEDVDDVLPADAAMNFYRVMQECLNNIIKHSQAKNVTIRLERDLHELQLLVTDDGCGFAANAWPIGGKGLGLKNIAERIRMLEGKLEVDSQPGRGTRIAAMVPIATRPA